MKKKISIQMMSIATLAIILTAILVMLVFYELFEKQVLSDLKVNAFVLCSGDFTNEENLKKYNAEDDELRITLINPQGTVLYDSSFDHEDMDNHSLRPEFKQALQEGEASVIR